MPTDPRPETPPARQTARRPSFHGLRALIVAPAGPPASGMQVQADLLAERLAAEGVSVRRTASNPAAPAMLAPITPVAAAWRRARFHRELIREIQRGIDVIHLHAASWGYFDEVVAPTISEAIDAGVRVIVRWDGGDADRFFAAHGDRVRPALSLAHEVTVATPYLADAFRARLGVQCRLIPNLVRDPEPGGPAPSPAPAGGSRSGPLRLLCARHLVRACGVDVVVRAASAAAAQGIDLQLTVAGSGPERAPLETAAVRTLGTRARFVGAVPHTDLPGLLAESDVVVNGSWGDNAPVILGEALAAGVPVASTDAGGIASIVQHGRTGLLTPVGDADALGASIASLARDPVLREDLAWRAKVEALRWTWEAVRGAWHSAYRPAPTVAA